MRRMGKNKQLPNGDALSQHPIADDRLRAQVGAGAGSMAALCIVAANKV